MATICRLINDGLYSHALASAYDLQRWLLRGGFAPVDPSEWRDCGNSAMPSILLNALESIETLSSTHEDSHAS
jgi:hypothetical protein